MRPSVEQAVADAIPHTTVGDLGQVICRTGNCLCGAERRRNVLLARLATQDGYVYLDRRH